MSGTFGDQDLRMRLSAFDLGAGRWRTLLRVGLVLLAVCLLTTAYATGWHRSVSVAALFARYGELKGYVADNVVTAALSYGLMYAAAVALSVPGAVWITILGGLLFGTVLGGLLASAASTVGAAGVFLIARTVAGDDLLKRAGPRARALADGFREDAFNYLLFLRLTPILPFWLVNLVPAAFGIRLRTYVLATSLGVVPACLIFAQVGAGFASVADARSAQYAACVASNQDGCHTNLQPGSLLTADVWLALAGLGLLALLPVAVKRWRARGGRAAESDERRIDGSPIANRQEADGGSA